MKDSGFLQRSEAFGHFSLCPPDFINNADNTDGNGNHIF